MNATAQWHADRIVIVTGASRCDGRALPDRLVAEDGTLCLTGRALEGSEAAVDSLGLASPAAVAVRSDDGLSSDQARHLNTRARKKGLIRR